MLFEQEFEKMLRQYSSIIDDNKKFAGLVKDLFASQPKNINLLLMAYNIGIAEDMKKTVNINNTFAYRYVKQLVDDYGLSRSNADWVVSVWCVCYGQKVLGKNCDITIQKKDAGPAIKADTNINANTQYGDLFTYANSSRGNGLAVTGFTGEKKQTIIFQNRANNKAVVEISDGAMQGEAIEEAILTDGIKYIGASAFADCALLHQVIMPSTVKEIYDNAFEKCRCLKSITLPLLLEKIGNNAFRGSGIRKVSIPKSVYWIGEAVFADCEELNNIEIPANITTISKSMFEGCTSLKKISLHESLEKIEDRAFFGCNSLDFIVIPDSVTEIGDTAFENTDKQFIIQCSFGSYAEQYCRKNKIKYQLV